METFTVDEVLAYGPCEEYTRERLEELWAGRECLTVLEVCDLDIPPEDKVWAGTREGVLTAAQREAWIVDRVATRCVRDNAVGSVIDPWARAWLDGTDRSIESARYAAESAKYAAARYAAESAKYAAAGYAAMSARYAAAGYAESAKYAAMYAAMYAAAVYAAAEFAAWCAERTRQVEDLREVLTKP